MGNGEMGDEGSLGKMQEEDEGEDFEGSVVEGRGADWADGTIDEVSLLQFLGWIVNNNPSSLGKSQHINTNIKSTPTKAPTLPPNPESITTHSLLFGSHFSFDLIKSP